jgi:hypothetical protein
MKPIVVHYYVGSSGRNYVAKCGVKADKTHPDIGWVRLEVDIFKACESTKRYSERQKVPCETCADRGGIVSLGGLENLG